MEYISDSYVILSILIFVSFCAGFIDSIAGGGGFILVPALMLAGLPPQQAIATNKVPAVFGTATAAYNFIRSKKVIWPIAIIGLIFALLGGAVGSRLNQGISADVLNKIVLMILPIAAIITFIPKKNMKQNVSSFSKKELYIVIPIITVFLCRLLKVAQGEKNEEIVFGIMLGILLDIIFFIIQKIRNR